MTAARIANSQTGFGLGLRTEHYPDFLAAKQPLDWLEIITDNFLVDGGKPLVMLDRLRQDYPMAMHGVAMSIGAPGGVDPAYLRQVKALAARVEPLWVSDHLCWIGPGPQQLHDLYPLPYTDEAARHVITQIQQAQDVLQRRLVLENVSSYIDYAQSTASEWQFLSYIAEQADCLLLVDVNNIYVSSVNHRFDPMAYLRGLPAHRVQQIHLAGHSDKGDHIIDTHDHPVAQPVWDLYASACRLFGPVAAMIERDAHIPELQTLLDELDIARTIARSTTETIANGAESALHPASGQATELATPTTSAAASFTSIFIATSQGESSGTTLNESLKNAQRRIASYVLDSHPDAKTQAMTLVREAAGMDRAQRLGIYHNAYRVRLTEVLTETFTKTSLFMSTTLFDRDAIAYAVSHPPLQRSLNRYGAGFPPYLASLYPSNPELFELAQLDWDLRACFDGPDNLAMDAEQAQADAAGLWLARQNPLHRSVRLRQASTNAVALWKAIDADAEVPAPVRQDSPLTLVVWRKGLQPHFQTLDPHQAQFVQQLAAGLSINEACDALAGTEVLSDPQELGRWLRGWLDEGLLRGD